MIKVTKIIQNISYTFGHSCSKTVQKTESKKNKFQDLILYKN